MRVNTKQLLTYLLLLSAGVFVGYQMHLSFNKVEPQKAISDDNKPQPVEMVWEDDFKIVNIESSFDQRIQKAYFFKPKNPEKKSPLIVSLHSWSGDYTQRDELAALCAAHNIHYIHPDFRGPNNTENSCCSDAVISDIDDAISYAISTGNIDMARIYLIGASGGGYATLCSFMKSTHSINTFSSWVPISDLVAWYHESKIRGNKYADDILACTSSENQLDEKTALSKSPINWITPANKLEASKLYIYSGINDGIQGSVPITHSINFYNKLLRDLSVTEIRKFVSDEEKLQLLESRKPLGEFGTLAERAICLKKEHGNLKLVVFEGNHEMLSPYAFQELIGENGSSEVGSILFEK